MLWSLCLFGRLIFLIPYRLYRWTVRCLSDKIDVCSRWRPWKAFFVRGISSKSASVTPDRTTGSVFHILWLGELLFSLPSGAWFSVFIRFYINGHWPLVVGKVDPLLTWIECWLTKKCLFAKKSFASNLGTFCTLILINGFQSSYNKTASFDQTAYWPENDWKICFVHQIKKVCMGAWSR